MRSADVLVAQYPRDAACAQPGIDPEQFFPPTDNHGAWAPPQAVRDICAACPVRAGCLEDNHAQRAGLIAGLTWRERRGWRPGQPVPDVPQQPRTSATRPYGDTPGELVRNQALARQAHDFAIAHGTVATAAHYGVSNMSLYRAWKTHGLATPGRRRRTA